MMYLRLFLSFLVIQNILGECILTPSDGPDPVPSIPNRFQTRVEINTDGQNQMKEFRYFYDYDYRRAAIEMRESNFYTKLIFNYDTDEIYELKSTLTFFNLIK